MKLDCAFCDVNDATDIWYKDDLPIPCCDRCYEEESQAIELNSDDDEII